MTDGGPPKEIPRPGPFSPEGAPSQLKPDAVTTSKEGQPWFRRVRNLLSRGKPRDALKQMGQAASAPVPEVSNSAKRSGLQSGIDKATELVHGFVRKSLPNSMYESSIPVYGGEFVQDPEGKMVLDVRFVRPEVAVDVIGDKFLRSYDDHTIKNPSEMLRRHPRKWLEFVFRSAPPRYRGSREQILENIKRLGLTEYYGAHPWGIEIKKPEIFNKGFALQDVLRKREIGAEVLADIDPFQALSEATAYIKKIHDTRGPFGDLVGDIMFQRKEGSRVVDPVLNVPDVILSPSKARMDLIRESLRRKGVAEGEIGGEARKVIASEQKATDILEHIIYCGFEIARQTKSEDDVRRAMKTIVGAYGDKDILKIVGRFLGRGRPTLPGSDSLLKEIFSQHNTKHLMADSKNADLVRRAAIGELAEYLNK